MASVVILVIHDLRLAVLCASALGIRLAPVTGRAGPSKGECITILVHRVRTIIKTRRPTAGTLGLRGRGFMKVTDASELPGSSTGLGPGAPCESTRCLLAQQRGEKHICTPFENCLQQGFNVEVPGLAGEAYIYVMLRNDLHHLCLHNNLKG